MVLNTPLLEMLKKIPGLLNMELNTLFYKFSNIFSNFLYYLPIGEFKFFKAPQEQLLLLHNSILI